MLKKYITVLFIFCAFFLNAQEDLDEFKSFKTDKTQEYDGNNAVFKLSFLFPAVGAEVRLAEKFSLDFSGRLRINAGFNVPSSGQPQFWFYPQPEIHLEPKWNYNIRKRNKKGKNTAKFSSNFLSIHSSFNFKVSPNTAHYLIVGPTWGIQRNMGKIGYFKFNSGLGYRHIFGFTAGNSRSSIVPILNLHLGIMF